MHSFSETDKLAYHGTAEDDGERLIKCLDILYASLTLSSSESLFRFNCFNVEHNYDPSIGLDRGEIAIPGHVLRREVFDPIIGTFHLSLATVARI
jgi:hypothetical protein